MLYFSIAILIVFCHGINAQSTYKAAVYGYSPVTANTASPQNVILENTKAYRSAAERAHEQGASIIVYPEYGLTSLVTDPTQYAIIADINTQDEFSKKVLTDLRDIAKGHNIYLVVNLLERCNTTNRYYSTNLVFDRYGDIIAKYRKINLSNEPNLWPGNETVTFTTDFGAKFGILIGNDIFHTVPSRSILNDSSVTDIAFSSAWPNTLPFYGALTVQHGYASATNVNLLAASYHLSENTNGGSGIYQPNGKILESYIEKPKLIVQEVNLIKTRRDPEQCSRMIPLNTNISPFGLTPFNISDFKTNSTFNAEKYKFENVDLQQFNQSRKICHNSICCTFDFQIENANNMEIYKLMVYDGRDTIPGSGDHHVRICSLLACKDNTESSCGARINGTTRFRQFSVKGNFSLLNDFNYQPVTLNFNLQTIPDGIFCQVPSPGKTEAFVQFTKSAPVDQVLVMGIWGKGAANMNTSGMILLVFVALARYIFV